MGIVSPEQADKAQWPRPLPGSNPPNAHRRLRAIPQQLNMTLVKVSEGTDKPHENKLFFLPHPPNTPPSTIKYNKFQKGPPEIKERKREREGEKASEREPRTQAPEPPQPGQLQS